MKKIICLISVIMMTIMLFSGCSNVKTENLTKLVATASVKDGKTSYSIGKIEYKGQTYYFDENVKINGEIGSFGSKYTVNLYVDFDEASSFKAE